MKMKEAFINIIIILALIDKNLSRDEKDLIRENFAYNFDIDDKIKQISTLDKTRLKAKFIDSLILLKQNISRQQKIEFIDFVLNLIFADNKLTLEEKEFFDLITRNWDIDIEDYINEKINV